MQLDSNNFVSPSQDLSLFMVPPGTPLETVAWTLASGSSLCVSGILSIMLGAFAEPTVACLSHLDAISLPSCLLPNSEGLKGDPLLLPGDGCA